MLAIHAIVGNRAHDGLPAFRLDLPPGARGAVVIGSHLRQDAVPQSERGITESLQAQALQQFVIDGGSRHNNLGPARPDPSIFRRSETGSRAMRLAMRAISPRETRLR